MFGFVLVRVYGHSIAGFVGGRRCRAGESNVIQSQPGSATASLPSSSSLLVEALADHMLGVDGELGALERLGNALHVVLIEPR